MYDYHPKMRIDCEGWIVNYGFVPDGVHVTLCLSHFRGIKNPAFQALSQQWIKEDLDTFKKSLLIFDKNLKNQK